MNQRDTIAVWQHHLMAVVGGYLGIYAILTRSDFFGNAMTSNLLYIVTSLFGRNLHEMLIRVTAVLLYMLGGGLTVYVGSKLGKNLHVFSLTVDAFAILLLGFLPQTMNPIVGLYPIFFAMSVQWNSFPSANGYVSSCIFSTNNTRQVSLALAEYLFFRDKAQLYKARFFAATLLFFHIGAALCIVLHPLFGVHAVWFGEFLLLPPAALTVLECRTRTAVHTA